MSARPLSNGQAVTVRPVDTVPARYHGALGRVVAAVGANVRVRFPLLGSAWFTADDLEAGGMHLAAVPRASIAEPEGYDAHLDGIERRLVRMPAHALDSIAGSGGSLGEVVDGVRFIRARRRGAPPLNPYLDGITVVGHVDATGTAALVAKGGA